MYVLVRTLKFRVIAFNYKIVTCKSSDDEMTASLIFEEFKLFIARHHLFEYIGTTNLRWWGQ